GVLPDRRRGRVHGARAQSDGRGAVPELRDAGRGGELLRRRPPRDLRQAAQPDPRAASRRRDRRPDRRRVLHVHVPQLRDRPAGRDGGARSRADDARLQGQGPHHDTHRMQPDVLRARTLRRLRGADGLDARGRRSPRLDRGFARLREGRRRRLMYSLLWRSLPGPWIVKLILCLILSAAAVYLLMEYVFPVIAPHMPFNDATIEEGG